MLSKEVKGLISLVGIFFELLDISNQIPAKTSDLTGLLFEEHKERISSTVAK
ncbi:MAG: hypothetical protein WCR56_02490 [Bacilli bacterium]